MSRKPGVQAARSVRLLTWSGAFKLGLSMLLLCLLSSCKNDQPPAPGASKAGNETQARSPAPKPPVSILVAYGSEKKAWLTDAIARFNSSTPHLADGQVVTVKGQAVGSGAAVEDLVDGTTKAHAWAPASSMYREVLNRAWTARQGAVGGQKQLTDDGKSLVLSPVVLAMWKPMAEALGWPDRPIGWAEVLALSKDPKGWATKGHPEWGAFKFGHTHPDFSNSGTLSVLAEVYGAMGKTRGMTSQTLAEPAVARFVETIEQSVVHYGKSTGFFADKMLMRGPSFLSAAVLYENLVVDSYQRPEYQNRDLDLVCVYPKEGTFWIDNPFYVLDAPWSDSAHQQAATLFRDFLLGPAEQAIAMTRFGFRPSDPKIAMGAPLDAAHGVDPKQPQTLLEVPDADVVKDALALWTKVKKTVDIVFVFDRSGSMSGEPLKQAKQGALDFLQQLDDRDRVSLLTFNDNVAPASAPALLSQARPALNQSVSNTFASGGTALYDAIAEARKSLAELAKQNPKRIFAVVVLTDGRDEHSHLNLEALQGQVAQSSETKEMNGGTVRLFTIAYGPGADNPLLAQLAEDGGGAAFAGDTTSIRQVYRDLAAFF